jgi:hypothetical protein
VVISWVYYSMIKNINIAEVKKCARVELRNGFHATVLDNLVNAQTRLCNVEGIVTEMGSVYSSDMLNVLTPTGWLPILHTPKQLAGRKARQQMGW